MKITVVFESGDAQAYEQGLWLLLNAEDFGLVPVALFVRTDFAAMPDGFLKKAGQLALFEIQSLCCDCSGIDRARAEGRMSAALHDALRVASAMELADALSDSDNTFTF